MKNAIVATETREEILDTIATCEEYLENVAEVEGKDLGPFAHAFTADHVRFAKSQIAFERTKLRILTLRELVAIARADEDAPARTWALDRLAEIDRALDRWELSLRTM